jgi:predicted TIM-barrel fold metal-dependent hydrolase
LPDAEFKQFEDFDIQVPETLAAAAAHPWTLLPLFHYDPRRWRRDQGTPSTERIVGGKKLGVYPRAWDEPFREHFRDGVRPFVGIKQYTALGYRPLDPRLPHQREFYAKCLELDLPIVCHCSSEGMYTLERPLYALREAGEDPARVSRLRAETLALMHARGLRDSLELEGDGKALDWREFWFSEKYVSPAAWREVLALPGHEKLRLCLAHFGGDAPSTYWGAKDPAPVDPHLLDEPWAKNPQKCQRLRWDDALVKLTKEHPNFYVDISYFVFDGSKERFRGLLEAFPHLRDKLLFGTDWWMIEKSGIDYAKYVGQTREALDRIDPELWQRFSWINPVRFYRLQENAEAIARWLETRAPDDPSQRKAHAQAVKRGLDVLRALHPGATDAR